MIFSKTDQILYNTNQVIIPTFKLNFNIITSDHI